MPDGKRPPAMLPLAGDLMPVASLLLSL